MISKFKIFESHGIDTNIYSILNNGTLQEKKDIIFLSKDHVFRNWKKRIIHALIHYDVELLEYCLTFFTDINSVDFFEMTALNYAIKNNKFEHLKLLIENGADVNIGHENNLYLAVVNTDREHYKYTLETLIELDCEWNDKFIENLHNNHKEYIFKKYKDKYEKYLKLKKSKKFNL